MSEPARGRASIEDIADIGIAPMRLEELVDRNAIADMAKSVHRLFGLGIRIKSASGNVLGEAMPDDVRAFAEGAHEGVKNDELPIEYDRRAVGAVLIGPYVDAGATGAVDRTAGAVPRATTEEIQRIADHLAAVLDLVLFSGHKALLTSQMHLASIKESYRELTVKNERLEEAYERLKELDRLKSNFLATVSHELRTPLTSIMGYGEMLAEGIGGPLNAEQLEFVETIRVKSEQLLGLIMSLLDLSKLESGSANVRLTRTAIGGVLREATSTVAPTAKKKGVSLSIDAPDGLPMVLGDPDRLRQVFINLSENAIKFTPSGGSVTLTARAAIEEPPDEPGLVLVAPTRQVVEVRVADTGIGVPEGERAKIFDPFYQVDQSSTREHGGTGLGLAIVKRLVDAHHGTIRVEANEPNGAVFIVALPAARISVIPPIFG